MQLKTARIRDRLALACGGLLGGLPVAQAAEPWQIDLGLMNYIEVDRNTGVELLVSGARELDDDGRLQINGELDVITGATPNGATASNVVQTFTMASGEGSYRVAPGELPADDTHMDTRMGVSTLLTLPYSETTELDYKAHLSMEFDFLSMGGGVDLRHDFNQRNTTLLLGVDFEYDRVHPVGDIPDPLASMAPPGDTQPRGESSVSRRVQGLGLGFTQILSQRSLMQIRYGYSRHSGYLTDPYKMLSVIDDTGSNPGATLDYLFEKRPGLRIMQSLYGAYRLNLTGDILTLSYRYLEDDWDIRSHTLDVKYRYKLDALRYLEPHFRLYRQQAAEFYRHSLPQSQGLSEFASADFRLAEFDALTLGVQYGKKLPGQRNYRVSLEYYGQFGDSHPADAVGLQQQQDLFPRLDVVIFKYVYGFDG